MTITLQANNNKHVILALPKHPHAASTVFCWSHVDEVITEIRSLTFHGSDWVNSVLCSHMFPLVIFFSRGKKERKENNAYVQDLARADKRVQSPSCQCFLFWLLFLTLLREGDFAFEASSLKNKHAQLSTQTVLFGLDQVLHGLTWSRQCSFEQREKKIILQL